MRRPFSPPARSIASGLAARLACGLRARAAGCLLGLAVLALPLAAAPASAAVLVSNIGQTGSGTHTLNGNRVVQRFTTGPGSGGYTLTSVEMNFGTAPSSSVTVSVYKATILSPVSLVATLTNPTSLAAGTLTFTAPAGTTLLASQLYTVLVDSATSGTLSTTNTDRIDPGAAAGWSIATTSWVGPTGGFAEEDSEVRFRVNGAANNAPTVANAIPDQSATPGSAFSYQFPANTFADTDTGTTLTYTATKSDNSGLPSWLTFTASTRTFSGTPQAANIGTVSVKVTASDGAASVSDTFDIEVTVRPTLSGARVLSDRTKLVLTFDMALDETVTLTNTPFTVKKTPSGGMEIDAPLSTTTAPSISGRTVTLTLMTAVLATDGVTVSYTKPTTGTNNRIRSTGGVEAASFSGQNAAHNRAPIFTATTVTPPTGSVFLNTQDGAVITRPGTLSSLGFSWTGFSDPDGDTLTRSITTTRADVIASGPTYVARVWKVYVEHKTGCALAGLTPTVPDNHVTTVTLTVTDPYGETASATRRYNSEYAAGSYCATLHSAVVDGTTLTLTYQSISSPLILPGTLSASEFTVEVDGTETVDGTEVEVTAVSAGTVTSVSVGGGTVYRKPYTLTLAEAVWGDQMATVTYDPASTNTSAPVVTDHEVTVSTSNRRPTITLTQPTNDNAPPGNLINFPVTIEDPDIPTTDLEIIVPGETPTDATKALTVTLSADRADVVGSLSYIGGRVYFSVGTWGLLCGLTPRPDNPFETDVTVTATDPDGASRQGTITLRTNYDPEANCIPSLASESPATVDGRTLTLNFYNLRHDLDEDAEPAAGDFSVTVAGSARTVSNVDVSGDTVVLTLASAVEKNETVTVSYTANAAKPIRFAGGVGDPAASFTNQAVENLTGLAPALQGAVVVDATLTLFYDEALDTTSKPAPTDFAVTVAGAARGITSGGVDVTGKTVVLTLASAVEKGQAVTVSYTKGTNPIRDTETDPYEASSFSGEKVENGTGDTTPPRLRSISVLDATITLTYNELLNPAAEPPISHFIVNDNSESGGRLTVTNVEIRGRTVVLTLAATLTEAKVATLDLSYTYDTTNLGTAIQDFGGNPGPRINVAGNLPPGVRMTWGTPRPPSTGSPPGGRSGPAPPGLRLSETAFELYETGAPATVTVALATRPSAAVTVDVASADPARVTAAPASLSFTPANWNQPQTVTLTALADADDVDREAVTVTLTERGGTRTARVTVTHREVPPVEVLLSLALNRVKEGLTLGLTVNLSAAPHRVVTVPVVATPGTATPDDYAVAPLSVTFGRDETTKTVVVAALADDRWDEPDETVRFAVGADLPPGVTARPQAAPEVTIEDRTRRTLAVQAWSARFGRTAATHVTDAVGDRLRATPAQASHLTIGGYRVPLRQGAQGQPNGAPSPDPALQRRGNHAGPNDAPDGKGLAQHARSPGGRGQGEGDEPAGATPDEPSTATTVLTEVARVLGIGPGAGAAPPDPRLNPGRTLEPGQTLSLRQVLLGSAFRLNLNAAAAAAGVPRLTAWGRVAGTTFDGQDGTLAVDGDVLTGTVGLDGTWDRWLGGLAVAHSRGQGTYTMPRPDGGLDAGDLDQTLTSLHPYLRYAVTDRLDVWGLVGYGWGALDVATARGPRIETDTTLLMGALGGRGLLLAPEDTGGVQLATRTEALFSRTRTTAGTGVDATDADAHRVRLILEGSRGFHGAAGQTFTPTVELGLRHDWGDAETGFGLELGSRVAYAHPGLGLTVEAAVRGLLAHEDEAYDEWGASGTVRLAPGDDGQGLALTLAPTWGATASGVEGLWARQTTRGLAAQGHQPIPGGRLAAEMGYGLALFDTGVVTPYAGTVLAAGGGRTYRLGTRWAGRTGWQVHLEGTRQEAGRLQPVNQGVQIRATWGF